MFYPLILLVLASGVLIFLMVFFIPQFQKMFEGFGRELAADHPNHHRLSAMG